jgi:hypothetical protein
LHYRFFQNYARAHARLHLQDLGHHGRVGLVVNGDVEANVLLAYVQTGARLTQFKKKLETQRAHQARYDGFPWSYFFALRVHARVESFKFINMIENYEYTNGRGIKNEPDFGQRVFKLNVITKFSVVIESSIYSFRKLKKLKNNLSFLIKIFLFLSTEKKRFCAKAICYLLFDQCLFKKMFRGC